MVLGDPQNPPLVFLHGFLGSGRSWRDIYVALQGEYFCITPDLPGHGENTKGELSSLLGFEFLTEWLSHLLDEYHAPQIHLVGYSLGGRAALAFAVRHPEKILSLTLESANPGILDGTERLRRLTEDTARAESILKNGMSAFVDKWYRMPLFASLTSQPDKLSAIMEAASQNDAQWMAKVIRELSPGLQTPLWDSLTNLSFPVLLMAGSKDKKYVQVIQKMAEQIPNSRSAIVPNAGHNVHAEQPEKYISSLKDFLANLEVTGKSQTTKGTKYTKE